MARGIRFLTRISPPTSRTTNSRYMRPELEMIADGAPRLAAAAELASRLDELAVQLTPTTTASEPDDRERFALLRATDHLRNLSHEGQLIELRARLLDTTGTPNRSATSSASSTRGQARASQATPSGTRRTIAWSRPSAACYGLLTRTTTSSLSTTGASANDAMTGSQWLTVGGLALTLAGCSDPCRTLISAEVERPPGTTSHTFV